MFDCREICDICLPATEIPFLTLPLGCVNIRVFCVLFAFCCFSWWSHSVPWIHSAYSPSSLLFFSFPLYVCLWTLPPPSAVNTDEERHVPQRRAAVDRLGKQEWRQIHFLIPKVSKSKLWVPTVGVWLRIRGWSRWVLLQNFPGFNSWASTLFLLVHSGLNTKLSQKSLAADYYSTSQIGGVSRWRAPPVHESKMISEFLVSRSAAWISGWRCRHSVISPSFGIRMNRLSLCSLTLFWVRLDAACFTSSWTNSCSAERTDSVWMLSFFVRNPSILAFLFICDPICMTPQRKQTKHLPDYPGCSDIKLWDWPLVLWISPVMLASEGYLLVANPAMADFQFWLMPCCPFSSRCSACHLLLKWVWIQILWSKRAVLQLICQTCQ